jgi:hypothetical protein
MLFSFVSSYEHGNKFSGSIKGRMAWVGAKAHIGEMTNTYKILVGKPEGKRQLGRSKRRRRIILKFILGK